MCNLIEADNLRINNSSQLSGATFIRDKITVDTPSVRFGEFDDRIRAEFSSDNARNSAFHNRR